MVYTVVLIAAMVHAIWNGLLKGSRDALLTLAAIRMVGVLMGAILAILFPMPAVEAFPYLLGSIIIFYLYYFFMLNAYRVGDFGQVYPISRGIAPILVTILGAVLAGEKLTLAETGAIVFICGGISLLAFSRKGCSLPAVSFALATGAAIAGYTFLSGLGVRASGAVFAYIGWLEMLNGIGVVIFAVMRRRSAVIDFYRNHWGQSLAAGLLSITGYGAALWAMDRMPMGPVAAVRETSVIFAALIGALVLREGFQWRRISAACTVAVGVATLVLLRV